MDPKLKASIDRILTVLLTYLITKYGSKIAGLETIIPDILVIGGMAVGVIYDLIDKRKAALVTQVANMPEVKKVELEQTVAAAQIANETPPNVTVTR